MMYLSNYTTKTIKKGESFHIFLKNVILNASVKKKEKNMKKLILIGLVISAMTISCKGKEPSLPDGVFAYKVGQFEVFTIVEG